MYMIGLNKNFFSRTLQWKVGTGAFKTLWAMSTCPYTSLLKPYASNSRTQNNVARIAAGQQIIVKNLRAERTTSNLRRLVADFLNRDIEAHNMDL